MDVPAEAVYGVLRGLKAIGAIEPVRVRHVPGVAWRLAPGVRVTGSPAGIDVAGLEPAVQERLWRPGRLCRSLSARTSLPCTNTAGANGICTNHARWGKRHVQA